MYPRRCPGQAAGGGGADWQATEPRPGRNPAECAAISSGEQQAAEPTPLVLGPWRQVPRGWPPRLRSGCSTTLICRRKCTGIGVPSSRVAVSGRFRAAGMRSRSAAGSEQRGRVRCRCRARLACRDRSTGHRREAREQHDHREDHAHKRQRPGRLIRAGRWSGSPSLPIRGRVPSALVDQRCGDPQHLRRMHQT